VGDGLGDEAQHAVGGGGEVEAVQVRVEGDVSRAKYAALRTARVVVQAERGRALSKWEIQW
jgi:hypothetical protein